MFVSFATLGTAIADGYEPLGQERSQSAAYNWSGFYAGLHGGWSWADIDWTHIRPDTDAFSPVSSDPSGYVFGGHLGLQQQFGNFVAGLEASIAYSDLEDTAQFPRSSISTHSEDIRTLYTLAGKLGYAMDRWLVYARGGYAWAQLDLQANRIPPNPFPALISKSDGYADGWLLGAGIENAITDNVIVGLQYDYLSLDDADRPNVSTETSVRHHRGIDLDLQVLTARVSYKFGRDREALAPLK